MIKQILIPCSMCHKTNDTSVKDALNQIKKICNGYAEKYPGRIPEATLEWSIHTSCKYGLSCDDLKAYDAECRNIADRMDKDLKALARDGGEDYIKVLQICRGNFPQVFKALEGVYAKSRKTMNE